MDLMPRTIYNEGRVTGLSAYETYVRQHLSEDPNTPPASEKQWLASSIALGSSLLLQLGSCGTVGQHSIVDIKLPLDCTLYAANNINAYFFEGSAEFDSADVDGASYAGWAKRITDYSQLISNNATDSPSGIINDIDSTNVPTQTLSDLSASQQVQLSDYLKIVDGIIIHPGEWKAAAHTQPEKSFTPDFATDVSFSGGERPVLRLHINGAISSFTQVLLTGFTNRSILSGIVGTEDQTATTDYENGDFLGPEDFPWVSKVFFNIPNITHSLATYTRTINSPTAEDTQQKLSVKASAVIDMNASDPSTFYNNYSSYRSKYTTNTTNPRYSYTVDAVNCADGVAVLTTYQKKEKYPPALYGTITDSDGSVYLNPLDVVAPGTVKMFNDVDYSDLLEYQTTYPGTWGINRASDGSLQILNNTDDGFITIGSSSITSIYLSNNGSSTSFESPFGILTGNNRPKLLSISTGNLTGYSLLMSTDVSSSTSQKNISIKPAALHLTHDNSNDNIGWSALVHAYTTNNSIDLLGDALKLNKYTISKPLAETGPSWSTIDDPYDITTGTAHAVFGDSTTSNNLHLYVSKDLPKAYSSNTNIPVNSIGSGWLMPKDSWYKNATGASSADTGSDKSWPYTYKLTKLKTSLPSDPNISNMLSTMEIGDYFWKPMFGAEYSSGHVESSYGEASGGVVSNPNYSHIVQYWESCLIIFGRTITGTCNPTIAYVDRWGSTYYINNDPNFVITVETYSETPSTNRTYKIRLQNKFLRADGDVLVTSEADYWICGTPFRNSTVLSSNT